MEHLQKMGVNWFGLHTFLRREWDRMFRVAIQVFVSPWISAFLYIFIFGSVLGSRIALISGVPYINFVFPGILMMNVVTSAFMASSSALYFARFLRSIEEMLVAPFSYLEMVAGFILSAVIRTVFISLGIVVIGVVFKAVFFTHPLAFFGITILASSIFALFGLIVGLWSKNFEQLSIVPTFILTPLSFLGGMFYSISMLPPALQGIAKFNPFFYFTDLMRYAMIGHAEAPLALSWTVTVVITIALSALVWHLFRIGWRLRE